MSHTTPDSAPDAGRAALPGFAINGKFLQPATHRSGVYRVALELVAALDKVLADNSALAAALPCRVIVPGDHDIGIALSRIRVDRDPVKPGQLSLVRRVKGVLWEQLWLPHQIRSDETLLNLCNIGPILHANALTMVHDAQVYTTPGSYSRAFRTWYRFVLPRLGRHRHGLLTVSRYSQMQLEEFGVAQPGRVRVIHNGCDHVLRLVPEAGAVEAAGLEGGAYVLALANRQPHKNIAMLLEAFHSPRLSDLTLALFGPARRKDFERQGVRVPPNVKFLGFVGDERLAGLLRHALALAFPSTTEGFGLPPLEAMALGCPVVAAPCGALPEVCGDAVLWAGARAPDQWARQLGLLREDAILRDDLRRRGLERAALFTWERAATALLEAVLGRQAAAFGLAPGARGIT